MRKHFRIVKRTTLNGNIYTVQKKSWLGFWYNPLNMDGHTIGAFNTMESAKETINQMLYSSKETVVYEIIEGD